MTASAPRGSTRLSSRGIGMIVVALLIVVGLWWMLSSGDDDPQPGSGNSTTTASEYDAAPSSGDGSTADSTDEASGLPVIAVDDLPAEAVQTMELIDDGGPYPYEKDGAVFSNFEGLLPDQQSGYYHEYTVPTPGSDDRGARRIVTGDAGEMYYTDDHYESFALIEGTG